MRQDTTPPSPTSLFLLLLLHRVHWVTKIIHHSCYFSSLRNCLLFKQKGYLNCYVARLFMPWHKNACLWLHGKVIHYNPNNFFSVGVDSSKCLWAISNWEMEQGLSGGLQRITVVLSLMWWTHSLSLYHTLVLSLSIWMLLPSPYFYSALIVSCCTSPPITSCYLLPSMDYAFDQAIKTPATPLFYSYFTVHTPDGSLTSDWEKTSVFATSCYNTKAAS